MGKYFGTDGIRGAVGSECINEVFAFRMGYALGEYLNGSEDGTPRHVVIGRDTRLSGQDLGDAMTRGLNARGVYVHDLGIVPTPAVAQVVIERHADLGVVITASHNPYTDNGIKLFDAAGCKFSQDEELNIEGFIEKAQSIEVDSQQSASGESYPLDGASYYINKISSLMHQNCMCKLKIVLDVANGATCETSPAVFRQLGANLVLIGDNPDGENINAGVGSEHPELLGEAVRKHGANVGIAHDGDGDRLVVCDENGDAVDGDVILGLFGLYALRSGALAEKTLVATIQSNLGLDAAIKREGGEVQRVDIGDRNVAARMREIGSNFGGENSGHIIFSDFASTGDGLLAALKLVDLMCKTGKPLSELATEVSLFPQFTANLKVEDKLPLESLKTVQAAVKTIEAELGDQGRVLIRYSGTEPKLRLLVEGPEADAVDAALESLKNACKADLRVIEG
ncbi:MAG: phosphoglucosamine mutase [Coraliomargarita sp.]